MLDNRTESIEITISEKNDIEELYREMCSHHKLGISKARAFTDSQQGFTVAGLVKLAIHLNLRIEIDAMKDKLEIWFSNDIDKPVDIILDEKTEKTIEENNEHLNEVKEEDPLDDVKFSEIKKDPIQGEADYLEDLF